MPATTPAGQARDSLDEVGVGRHVRRRVVRADDVRRERRALRDLARELERAHHRLHVWRRPKKKIGVSAGDTGAADAARATDQRRCRGTWYL
jgi:hypothetical protein